MILVIDGANFLHRSRSGFQLGDYNVVYNFFRSLRPLIEKFKPTRVYFTLEGSPKRQLALLPEYKANRAIDASTPAGEAKLKSLDDFYRQKEIIVDLLTRHAPVSVVRHPDFEGDDVIFNLINRASKAIDFIVVSTDTDFIQLLQEFGNVKLYNPISKEYMEAPEYDYVIWKSLRGDQSDNVPALVTEARAVELSNDPEKLEKLCHGDEHDEESEFGVEFLRNYQLIKLHEWTDEEALKMTCSTPTKDWDAVKQAFDTWAFKSITKEGAWDKFVGTFEPLWG